MNELHVVFKLGTDEYIMPASEVLQMESYTGATSVPGVRDYVAGIVQVRGKVVPVIDLHIRFGHAAVAPSLSSRLVIGQDKNRPVALLVDSAREVIRLTDAQLEIPPDVLREETRGFVKAVARLEGRLLMLIDFQKVIGEEQLHAN